MPTHRHSSIQSSAGFTSVYGLVVFTVLAAFVSLAVDYGRVQVARTELQRAADAAARSAAMAIGNGPSAAVEAAVETARDNLVDNRPLVIEPHEDVEFGTWDGGTRTFTPLGGSARSGANAIRITARRTAARGNPIPLLFARVIGKASCDVQAQVIAQAGAGPYPFVGLSSITAGNNTFVGSYNAVLTTNPAQGSASSRGSIASNGTIAGGNNSTVLGSILLGPDASVSGFSTSGGVSTAPSNFDAPTQKSWSPQPNPASVPQNLTVTGTQILPGGTYWLTSLSLGHNDVLGFAGPATIYLNGPASFGHHARLHAYNDRPANLVIYQLGAHDFGSASANSVQITALLEGPNNVLRANNNLILRGRATFRAIDVRNNAELWSDESLGAAAVPETPTVRTVK